MPPELIGKGLPLATPDQLATINTMLGQGAPISLGQLIDGLLAQHCSAIGVTVKMIDSQHYWEHQIHPECILEITGASRFVLAGAAYRFVSVSYIDEAGQSAECDIRDDQSWFQLIIPNHLSQSL